MSVKQVSNPAGDHQNSVVGAIGVICKRPFGIPFSGPGINFFHFGLCHFGGFRATMYQKDAGTLSFLNSGKPQR